MLNAKNIHRLKALALLFCLIVPASSYAAGRQLLHGHRPEAVNHATRIGRLESSKSLHLSLGLPLRNPDQLNSLLRDLYDPASPRYRRFLSPDAFNSAFAPTPADYDAVKAFVQSQGLTVIKTSPDRRMLEVAGSAASVERAFQVTLHEYRHPTEDRTFFAPDAEPSVDTGMPVADIWGLSDYPKPRPLLRKGSPHAATPAATPNAGTGPSGTYRGYDFRNAYLPDATNLTGTGQVLALFQVDGFYTNDIATYASQAGLPAVPLETVLLDGFSGTPVDVNGNGEVSLDIEMAISMAPGLSRIIVYEGNPAAFYPTHILSRIATDNRARQVSSSWSWSGGPSATLDSYFQQMAAQGQSYFQASGDSDAYLFGAMDNTSATTTPVDNPYVTSVGGTTLTTGPGASWLSETVWNWGGGVGSSGGISSYYTIPSWQQGIDMSASQGSTLYRNIPDVAMIADKVYVCYNNGSTGTFGGTSCAAPLWAGFCALINQQAAAANMPPVGFLNPALYAIGKASGSPSAFHDTVTGNNTSSTSPANYYAVNGYDLCTGWGSPNGMGLISALLPYLSLKSATYSDTAGGNGNGFPDPGETLEETVAWINNSAHTATNLSATLVTGTPGVTIVKGESIYPDIPALALATNMTPLSYRLSKSIQAGTLLAFTNLMSSGSTIITGTFSRIVGAPSGPFLYAVTNLSGTRIPANSTLYVTNSINMAGNPNLQSITAGVRLDFSRDSALVIALQHPDGSEILLAGNRGGTGANFGQGTPPATMDYTVFDDFASTAIGSGTAPFVGTYRPDGTLSNLSGKPLNGVWRLRLTTSQRKSGTFYSWNVVLPTRHATLLFNHPPVAGTQEIALASEGMTNLVLHASDPDGDPLTLNVATLPAHGSLSNFDTNSGAVTYSADAGFSGTDDFTFVASDGWTSSLPASVTIRVTAAPAPSKGMILIIK